MPIENQIKGYRTWFQSIWNQEQSVAGESKPLKGMYLILGIVGLTLLVVMLFKIPLWKGAVRRIRRTRFRRPRFTRLRRTFSRRRRR